MDQEKRNQKNRTGTGTAGGKKRPPVRYVENGRPIVPKTRPVLYDDNGRPIVPKKRPVRYDENGRPIRPKQPQNKRPQPKRYEKYEQADAPAFDRHAYAQKRRRMQRSAGR